MCFDPGASALALAKGNLERHFLLVLLVERFTASLTALEKLLPRHFRGVSKVLAEQGASRVNLKSKASPHSTSWRLETADGPHSATEEGPAVASLASSMPDTFTKASADFLDEELRFDRELYDFASTRLETQLRACSAPGARTTKKRIHRRAVSQAKFPWTSKNGTVRGDPGSR